MDPVTIALGLSALGLTGYGMFSSHAEAKKQKEAAEKAKREAAQQNLIQAALGDSTGATPITSDYAAQPNYAAGFAGMAEQAQGMMKKPQAQSPSLVSQDALMRQYLLNLYTPQGPYAAGQGGTTASTPGTLYNYMYGTPGYDMPAPSI